MPKPLPDIVLGLFLWLVPGLLSAQETPSVKSSVDKNQILIGEPIRFSIDVKSPMVSGNQMPQFDSIPHFELMEKARVDSVISATGASYHFEWKLTSFDSGTRLIPAFAVMIGKQVYKTDSLAVEVSYGKVDTTKDYHDIKGIIDLENPDVKYIPWILGALTLLAGFGFYWFYRFPFTKAVAELQTIPADPASSFDEAMATMEQLKIMLREDPASVKLYYYGMNDTLRVFLNRRLGLVTMEKTSEELIMGLSNLNLEPGAFSKLTAALRMGDFVKFAKYVPGPYENESNWDVIRSAMVFINESSK